MGFPNAEPKGKNFYTIFPNPSSGVFSIANVEMFNQIQINSFYGELIMKERVNQNLISIDLSDKKSGLYILVLQSKDQTYTTKISLIR